jgi:hypothetical protein
VLDEFHLSMEALGDAIPIGIIWFDSMGGRGMGLRRDEA